MNKYSLIFLILPIAIFAGIATYICGDFSKDGRTPVIDEDRYLVYIKDEVFKTNIDSTATWLNVIDNSKTKLQFFAADTTKFNSVFMGPDSLAMKTIEKFPGYGFEFGTDIEHGTYFSIPRITQWNKSDYVIVPAWLMAALIDEGVLVTAPNQ